MSTAGTGKSYIINAIWGRLHEIAKEHNLHDNNMVVAPTGVAAFNIEGSTIHSSLSVPNFHFLLREPSQLINRKV
jgi:hypothetical protein